MLGKGYSSIKFGKQASSFEGNFGHENSEIPKSSDCRSSDLRHQHKLSTVGKQSFGYQEYEADLHPPRSKRSLMGNFLFPE